MNRASKITVAVSAVAVAGLVALAAPAVGATVTELASWPVFHAPVERASNATPTPSAQGDAAARAAAEEDGLVYLGDGISRPAGGPGNCTASAFINIMAVGDEPA